MVLKWLMTFFVVFSLPYMCAHPHYPRPTQLSNPGYATGDITAPTYEEKKRKEKKEVKKRDERKGQFSAG